MSQIQYIPNDYLDEVNPPGRDTPNDWLIRSGDGFALDRPEANEPESRWNRPRPLMDQEIVTFSWPVDHGSGTVTVTTEGWSCTPPMPEAATDVCLNGGYTTSVGASIEEAMLTEFGDVWPEGNYEVQFYAWHDRAFRFDAASARFVDEQS